MDPGPSLPVPPRGLVIYNAAYSPVGAFLAHPVEDHLKAVDVNVRGPLLVSHYFGQPFSERGRGDPHAELRRLHGSDSDQLACPPNATR